MKSLQKKTDPVVFIMIVLTVLVVIVIDALTPLGYAEWIIYLLPVALTLFTWRPVWPLVVAAIATILMLLGFFISPPRLDATLAVTNRSVGAVVIWIVSAVCFHSIRTKLAVSRQEWMQTALSALRDQITGELGVEQLAQRVLTTIAERLDALVGTVYAEDRGTYRRIATYALPASAHAPDTIELGRGLTGQAIRDRKSFLVYNLPRDYFRIGSATGETPPGCVIVQPTAADGHVNGVIEFGFLRAIGDVEKDFMESAADVVGVAIRSALYRARLQELLEETQRQSEELQTQAEELRVSNEELEEQSRALKESQFRLESQQAELEQTNSQLEEQAQLLETQKDELARSKSSLEDHAKELRKASQYKSEFLANMSHELRTPLNSSLILSKLLADNRDGNLTQEQVKFAQTIHSSGNDLLELINDILDLAKIESGRLEIRLSRYPLATLVENMKSLFVPLADAKGIAFNVKSDEDVPPVIVTDYQRLEQVMRNLIGNAVKFTQQGSVELRLARANADWIELRVQDTGIGIPAHQQEIIFEAFRQADGTTNRRFGGTGLGLTISRNLAKLLGGEIRVQSHVGEGSTFLLALPIKAVEPTLGTIQLPDDKLIASDGSSRMTGSSFAFDHPSQLTIGTISQSLPSSGTNRSTASAFSPRINDSTNTVTRTRATLDELRHALAESSAEELKNSPEDRRTILIIEDDINFSGILVDLARELGFQALSAQSANEGLQLAMRARPGAIVLDIGLPDQSGLSVLDHLKRDVRTRHIPVHVISASDHAETALTLGAVGYMLKPVKREQLVEAFQGLQTRLSKDMQRVLIVEDDEVQLDSMQHLLGSPDVETIGVRTANDCLTQLSQKTFDCMVLDLNLPDASGFSLLETLCQEEQYSFPPVIVYTGRDLSADEEQRLRQYSRSIIIKGAKSPERLLDEVTLFLHQVVSDLSEQQQEMIKVARSREAAIEGRRVLVVEDDVRNVFALTSILEPRGMHVEIARNGREALQKLEQSAGHESEQIDLVLMDLMMPEMDGLTAIREIRKRSQWARLPIIALTAKAMRSDQEQCLEAGANDYMSKPLDIEKLLSLVRVWMPR